MSQEIFKQLLYQYISGELTPEEKSELNLMMNQPEYNDVLESFVKEIMISDDYSEIDSPAIKAKIDAYLESHIHEENDRPAVFVMTSHGIWLRVAAIFVLVMLGAVTYFSLFHRAAKETAKILPAPTQFRNDVTPPESDKAILTLANGQQIVLNNAAAGSLITQGNTNVMKTHDGGIVYNAQGKATENSINILSVPRGSRSVNLTLGDGSRVWLNAASSLRYPVAFTGDQRVVEITGEAYFEVAKNVKMPFVVKKLNDDTRVKVLGTHFNVNAYDDERSLKVSLLEGSVNVTHGTREVTIKPGQQAVVTESELTVNNDADMEKIIAWKNNEFIFEYDDIETIMRQLSRWYDIEVVYNQVPDRKYIGRITRSVPLSQVLDMFESVGYVRFAISGKTVTVIPIQK